MGLTGSKKPAWWRASLYGMTLDYWGTMLILMGRVT